MTINLNNLSINGIKSTTYGGSVINVIYRENSSPKNALDVSFSTSGVDALDVVFQTSTKDAVVGVPLPNIGGLHDDNGGFLNIAIGTRKNNQGTIFNVIKRVDTSEGVVFTVIYRENSSPKNALDVGNLTSAYDALDVGQSEADEAALAPAGPGYSTDPYGVNPTLVHMYVDTVGNTISDQKSRGGAG